MSSPTPFYITMEEFTIHTKRGHNTLPVGSFVREISECYLPQYIREEEEKKPLWDKFVPETQMWVYCHYGILTLPRAILRKGS